MTRKEEIINYANSFKGVGVENEELKETIRLAIIDGAMWADQNPIHNEDMNLEKEIDSLWNPRFSLGWDENSLLSINHEGFSHIARHFFELGLKAREECIKSIPLNGWQIPCADPNYPCENPQMDCINCPRFGHPQGTITITSSMDEKESEQLVGKATFQTDSWSEIKEDK